jgi:regulator of cell morphogenesis and NO signaling
MHTFNLTDRTVGELATDIPAAIRVFQAWKIDYCCGGKRPLADACASVGKTVEEFAAAIALAPAAGGAEVPWTTAPLATVSAQICERYHRYTREELPTLQALATKVYGVHGGRNPELGRLEQLVGELTGDMIPHMLKEEQVLFPYVDQLEEAAAGKRAAATPFFGTVKNPVQMMMNEHDRVGELLVEARSITSDYSLPPTACFSYTQLFRRLEEFERLTHEHIHVENNIYFPRAVELEERMGNTASFAAHPGNAGASHACGCGGH